MKAIIRRGKHTGKAISALHYTESNVELIAKASHHSVQQINEAFQNKEGIGGDLSEWYLEDWANKETLMQYMLR